MGLQRSMDLPLHKQILEMGSSRRPRCCRAHVQHTHVWLQEWIIQEAMRQFCILFFNLSLSGLFTA